MKALKHIFLGGGGSEKDSSKLDEKFASLLDLSKPLIYIPNAMDGKKHDSALEWLKSTMNPLDVVNIKMWNDLKIDEEISSIAGIYIGGGDTVKLLNEIRMSIFSDYLISAVQQDIPVYGGSAGAIILGSDIRTAPEANQLNAKDASGMKILLDYSIFCHYNDNQTETVKNLVSMIGHSIIAIPEKAGGYVNEGKLQNYGAEPISLFINEKIISVLPGYTIDL